MKRWNPSARRSRADGWCGYVLHGVGGWQVELGCLACALECCEEEVMFSRAGSRVACLLAAVCPPGARRLWKEGARVENRCRLSIEGFGPVRTLEVVEKVESWLPGDVVLEGALSRR